MKKELRFLILIFVGIIMVLGVAGCNKTTSTGALYTVKEAYENGWLTKDDLMSIAYYHNNGRWHNEEIMDETYEPIPKTPEVLSKKTESKIKNAAAAEYREKYDDEEAVAKGFTITEYDGTYGDCVAIMMRDVYSGEAGIVWTDTVAGVNFSYGGGRTIIIWRDNN